MEGICCLKGCGASIEDIKEYCRLCLLLQSEKNLKARYAIILKQRDKAYERLKKAEETVKYMESKVRYYEAVFSGLQGKYPLLPQLKTKQNYTRKCAAEH